MPEVSLVVILHGDREPLRRLLTNAQGCYDELLVIHDGPDFEDVASVVKAYGGRFVERPRAYSQEPHVPYALAEAHHDWVLRFDSDEYPSPELKQWLQVFRRTEDPPAAISGFRFICPAWNGYRAITRHWPNKHVRLFHKQRVRLVGVCEHGALPDFECPAIPLTFRHEPALPSQGLRNILKPRNKRVRRNLARALLGVPQDHPTWRYDSTKWPPGWQAVKEHPVRTALFRLLIWPPRQALAMIRAGDFPWPSVWTHAALFHASVCYDYWRQRRQHKAA